MVNIGSISFISEIEGGYDGSGNPIAPTKTPSDFYTCNIKVIKRDYPLLADGQWKQAAYSAIIDNHVIEEVDLSNLTEVVLRDVNLVVLGTFQVQNKEKLVLTNQTKIVV